MSDFTVDGMNFSWAWAVDNDIRSETASNSGASPLPSYGSVVNCFIRSGTVSNFGTSPAHSLASEEDNAMRSNSPASGTSSDVTAGYVVEGLQLFSPAELIAATNNFSLDNKIGAGSFGVVYRGKLVDGSEVAIKRGETWPKENNVFHSKLLPLSRLHHSNLVRLVGLCEKKYERLLVYEYMKNGSLYDGLHDKNNVEKGRSVLNSWKMRIKIALDASRGLQYLHKYAASSITRRDIKSSNILLDATWTARVSLLSPEPDHDHQPLKTARKSDDVYGLGVVLLELLTGKRPIFLYWEKGGTLLSVHHLVDFAVPAILAGDLVKILDSRVGPPDVNEAEAVDIVGNTAMHCVNLEGKDRTTVTEIVVNLERALAICDCSPHDIIYSGNIYDVSVRKAVLQHCLRALYNSN